MQARTLSRKSAEEIQSFLDEYSAIGFDPVYSANPKFTMNGFLTGANRESTTRLIILCISPAAGDVERKIRS